MSLLFTRAFGTATMPRAVALFGMFSVPLTFVLPPTAGWVHDVAGTYQPVMTAILITESVVAALFCAIALTEPGWSRRRQREPAA